MEPTTQQIPQVPEPVSQINSVVYTLPTEPQSKKIIVLIVVLAAVVIGGGAAAAYFTGAFVSLPELTISSFDKARTATSGTYEATITLDTTNLSDRQDNVIKEIVPVELDSKKIYITTQGAYDVSDNTSKKTVSKFDVESGLVQASGEVRLVDGILYAMITQIPKMALLDGLSQYVNKWYSFDTKKKSEISLPFDAISEKTSLLKDLTDVQKEKVYSMTKNARLITIVKKLPSEKINGTATHHFTFDIDREGIIAYTEQLKNYLNEIGKENSALSRLNSEISSTELDRIKDFSGELWIGRSDGLMRRAVISFTVHPDSKSSDSIGAVITVDFDNWNKIVNIEKPEQSISLEELLTGSLESARGKAQDARVKAGLSNLRPQAELYFNDNNSYSGLCTSAEVEFIKADIENSGGTGFMCKAQPQEYVIAVRLPEDGQVSCVDSMGDMRTLGTFPTKTNCSPFGQ